MEGGSAAPYTSITIHAPRVGRDSCRIPWPTPRPDFNPRAPCGARRAAAFNIQSGGRISIHAPRVGRDQRVSQYCAGVNAFQSTRPVWGATFVIQRHKFCQRISIHAPRVGRDAIKGVGNIASADFNPRAPCGARLCKLDFTSHALDFNPRAPCGARPRETEKLRLKCVFQSTRPVWGATASTNKWRRIADDFNPRAPCGARHIRQTPTGCFARFQSTRPVWGATQGGIRRGDALQFQSTRPVWGATGSLLKHTVNLKNFNPRAPCGARP